MCGRFHIDAESDIEEMQIILEQINRRYAGKPALAKMTLGEVRPTSIVPVIANSKSLQPMPFLMQWGFTGFGDGKKAIINARSETAMEKSMFRKPLQERRCLIPASHYYEWQTQGNRKVKHAIKTVEPMIYMAGIYRFEEKEELPVFTILTRAAANWIRDIHDRMPVILPHSVSGDWLSMTADVPALIHKADERVVFRAVYEKQHL